MSGSSQTNSDAIDKVAIAIPPRAFPKARRAANKSRHSDHKKSIGLTQIVSDLFSLQIGTFILSASKL